MLVWLCAYQPLYVEILFGEGLGARRWITRRAGSLWVLGIGATAGRRGLGAPAGRAGDLSRRHLRAHRPLCLEGDVAVHRSGAGALRRTRHVLGAAARDARLAGAGRRLGGLGRVNEVHGPDRAHLADRRALVPAGSALHGRWPTWLFGLPPVPWRCFLTAWAGTSMHVAYAPPAASGQITTKHCGPVPLTSKGGFDVGGGKW